MLPLVVFVASKPRVMHPLCGPLSAHDLNPCRITWGFALFDAS